VDITYSEKNWTEGVGKIFCIQIQANAYYNTRTKGKRDCSHLFNQGLITPISRATLKFLVSSTKTVGDALSAIIQVSITV
jgi:hypothetical protein